MFWFYFRFGSDKVVNLMNNFYFQNIIEYMDNKIHLNNTKHSKKDG